MKHGKDVIEAFSALILPAGVPADVPCGCGGGSGGSGGGMKGVVETGPAAIMYPLSPPGVIGSSADASGSSILIFLAAEGISTIAFPKPRTVGVLTSVGTISVSAGWAAAGEGLGVIGSPAGIDMVRLTLVG